MDGRMEGWKDDMDGWMDGWGPLRVEVKVLTRDHLEAPLTPIPGPLPRPATLSPATLACPTLNVPSTFLHQGSLRLWLCMPWKPCQ